MTAVHAFAGGSAAVRPAPRTFEVMGIPVSAIDMGAAVATIEDWVDAGARHYVCVAGAHGLVESWTNPALRRCLRAAGLVTPDGMPLVWVARLRGIANVSRVYGPDLMTALSGPSARRDLRHFYYGGGEGVAERLRERLRQANPALDVVGCITPPFRAMTPAEESAMVSAINEAKPDILWVGLGAPKQELWMMRLRDRLEVPVMIGVGAAFDFLSGTKRQAPSWMRRSGLEWAFRLGTEPRRLFARYAIIVPCFLLVLGWEAMRTVARSPRRA